MNLYATLDGRQEGVPVNKNANPSILLQQTDHTSHVLSATSFDQTKFSGGQPIDLYFDKTWFNSAESRNKIKALIKTYFQLGGLQLQVNSIDIDLLEKAHESPQDYPFVIVRKGGYSVRFNEMNKHNRSEFITHAKRMNQDV
jgi:formate C-acetyltransferase